MTGNLDITIFDDMTSVEDAWRRLEADENCSLHQSYDWCNAWRLTNGMPLAIVFASLGGEPAFILPLEIVRNNVVRVAQFVGDRFSNINTGLFSPIFLDAPESGRFAEIMEHVAGLLAGRTDLVSLRNVPLVWRGVRSPLAQLPSVENQNSAFQLEIASSFQKTIARLDRKKRLKRFRNQTRKLEAAGGYDHIVATDAGDRHALLDRFFQQKAERFRSRSLPNVFQAPETQIFFHRLLDLEPIGRSKPLEMHALCLRGEHEGHIAAIAALSRKGDHVICQFGSIDESVLAEASPGEFLFWLMIEQASARDVAIFDFGIGDQPYKRAWCTRETIHHDILLPVSQLGAFAALAHRGVTRTKAAIKEMPQVYALLQRLRAKNWPRRGAQSS
ncbi:GNAT family N-acetyltransferase [Rhizobiaceae bacterium n13]|uniref:GNAT family N-acetyltransferase n=1 Tax=Ferirhizobium litorale TaxID=2927786 RepID=A0AAE3QC27_9HYPH|nr:GNAT family N-acetyltransferase [Fererhizobium litorale]MDI7861003.1 GNAT family N-acetyltransferase [Fererhizobium litorale]MDI7921150.1 GNAT family N-acetyltransferase [Fererhizobium litorale]